MPLTVTLTGTRAVQQAMQRLGREAPQLVAQAVAKERDDVFVVSQARVPVDTGALKASGEAPPVSIRGSRVEAVITYGNTAVQYALSVHENPRAGQTGGVSPQGQRYRSFAESGQWKYLESAFMERARGMPQRMAAFLRAVLTARSRRGRRR